MRYCVRSLLDVWVLGIALGELSAGKFPEKNKYTYIFLAMSVVATHWVN